MTNLPDTKTFAASTRYAAAGIAVIPVKSDGTKQPAVPWKVFQKRLPTDEERAQFFANGNQLGIVCGVVSGNFNLQDFDRPGLCDLFEQAASDNGLTDLIQKLVRIQTPSGGDHFYFRSTSAPAGNLKLARAEDGSTLIETRGEGGQGVAPPSVGYTILRGHPTNPPLLTDYEAQALFDIARLFDEKKEERIEGIKQGSTGRGEGLKPGADFNERGHDVALDVLQAAGWKILYRHGATFGLQRPGKAERSVSATFNHGGHGYLYCFSTNAIPFEAERGYSPFAIYALLKHGGKFSEAAGALGKFEFGDPPAAPKLRGRPPKPPEPPEGGEKDENGGNQPNGEMSEFELAEIFAKQAEPEWCYVEGDQWWRYQYNHWQYSSGESVTRAIQEFLEQTGKVTPARVRNVQFLAKSMLGPVPMKAFNARTTWIPLANGVYDTQTGELLPHDPLHRLTHVADYEYVKGAECPLWEKCLREWLLTEKGETCQEWIDILQEYFGYCLIPDTRAQVSMLWNGEGANGKGTSTRVLENLVGRDYTIPIPVENLHMEYTRAELYGKLVGFVNEPDVKAMQKNGNWFKAIVGGDPISARRPTEKVFSFIPVCRLVITTNVLPSTKDTSTGYYRRLIMIDWRYDVPAEKRDGDLDDKLRMEMPGILNWALQGLRRFQERRKFIIPEESTRLLMAYRNSQDDMGRFFEEEVVFDPMGLTPARELYSLYKRWCEDNGMRASSETMLGLRLGKMKCIRQVSRFRNADGNKVQMRCWTNIRLVSDQDSDVSDDEAEPDFEAF